MPLPTDGDKKFVQQCLQTYRERMSALLSNAPVELRQSFFEELRDTPLLAAAEEDILDLERMLPVALPATFTAYLISGRHRGVECAEIILPRLDLGDPLEDARRYLLQRELWAVGIMQFAGGPCGDPVCFDLNTGGANSDYHVVVFNHDQIPPDAWRSAENLRPRARKLAVSFAELLQGLCFDSIRY